MSYDIERVIYNKRLILLVMYIFSGLKILQLLVGLAARCWIFELVVHEKYAKTVAAGRHFYAKKFVK